MGETVLERMKRIDADKKIADFMAKEKMSYAFKVKYARIRAQEFVRECDKRGLNCHVSVGGLDSIVLLCFLRSIKIDVPGISVSHLEDKSIQQIHKSLGVERIGSAIHHTDENGTAHRWTKQLLLQEFGFPVLSKEVAAKIIKGTRPVESTPISKAVAAITRTDATEEDMFDLEEIREISEYLRDYYRAYKRREAQE